MVYQGQSMRPGQNKRMRGRNNNNNGGNRRGPNPLTRSYESNGPDVKVRGTAQHIGEKYLQLARDAQTSGDPVAAENYLQHAEHYFRIIAAAQQAQQQAQLGYTRQPGDEIDDGGDDDDVVMPDRFSLPSERMAVPPNGQAAPQPTAERPAFNPERPNGQDRYDRPDRTDNQERPAYRNDRQERAPYEQRQDREPRQERPYQDRGEQRQERPAPDRSGGPERQEGGRFQGDRGPRNDRFDRNNRQPRYGRDGQENREPRPDRPYREARDYRDPAYREQPRPNGGDFQHEAEIQAPAVVEPGPELPAFITAPVRAMPPAAPEIETQASVAEQPPLALAPVASPEPVAASADGGEAAAEAYAVRPRRRRRPRTALASESDSGAGEDPASE